MEQNKSETRLHASKIVSKKEVLWKKKSNRDPHIIKVGIH